MAGTTNKLRDKNGNSRPNKVAPEESAMACATSIIYHFISLLSTPVWGFYCKFSIAYSVSSPIRRCFQLSPNLTISCSFRSSLPAVMSSMSIVHVTASNHPGAGPVSNLI